MCQVLLYMLRWFSSSYSGRDPRSHFIQEQMKAGGAGAELGTDLRQCDASQSASGRSWLALQVPGSSTPDFSPEGS